MVVSIGIVDFQKVANKGIALCIFRNGLIGVDGDAACTVCSVFVVTCWLVGVVLLSYVLIAAILNVCNQRIVEADGVGNASTLDKTEVIIVLRIEAVVVLYISFIAFSFVGKGLSCEIKTISRVRAELVDDGSAVCILLSVIGASDIEIYLVAIISRQVFVFDANGEETGVDGVNVWFLVAHVSHIELLGSATSFHAHLVVDGFAFSLRACDVVEEHDRMLFRPVGFEATRCDEIGVFRNSCDIHRLGDNLIACLVVFAEDDVDGTITSKCLIIPCFSSDVDGGVDFGAWSIPVFGEYLAFSCLISHPGI